MVSEFWNNVSTISDIQDGIVVVLHESRPETSELQSWREALESRGFC